MKYIPTIATCPDWYKVHQGKCVNCYELDKNNWKDDFEEKFVTVAKNIVNGEVAYKEFNDLTQFDVEGVEDFIESLLAEQKKELMEEYKDRIQKYKSYYNPVGDELNKGKHIACDDLLESLKHHEKEA